RIHPLSCHLSYPRPLVFFLLTRPPPTSTLFPYTTLFRSYPDRARADQHRRRGQQWSVYRRAGLRRDRFQRRCPVAGNLCAHRDRSEEHTSELQSLTNLVCRLLLEKKKHHMVHTNTNLTSQ